jgi:hypothetical protein
MQPWNPRAVGFDLLRILDDLPIVQKSGAVAHVLLRAPLHAADEHGTGSWRNASRLLVGSVRSVWRLCSP